MDRAYQCPKTSNITNAPQPVAQIIITAIEEMIAVATHHPTDVAIHHPTAVQSEHEITMFAGPTAVTQGTATRGTTATAALTRLLVDSVTGREIDLDLGLVIAMMVRVVVRLLVTAPIPLRDNATRTAAAAL